MKKLLKHMSIYGIGGVLTKTINILLLPIYTRVLMPADYGVLELVYMAGSLITILYGFMINSGFIRYYYNSKDEKYRQALLGSAFWFTVASSVAFFSIFFLFADPIAGSIFRFAEGAYFLRLISISTAISVCGVIFYSFLMVKERSKQFVATNTISLLITVGLTVYFVVFTDRSIEGVLYAQIIGRTIELIMLASFLLRATILQFSFRLVKEMLKYSVPLIPLQLAAFVLNLSNRYFLQEYSALDDVGLYSLGYRFASILLIFAIEPLRGFTPYILSLIDNPQKCKKTLADFTRYYVFAIMVIILMIAMFSKEVILIMSSKDYYSGWTIVYWLTLAYGFYGLIVLSSLAIEIAKKNWISSSFWIVGAGANITLNVLLIPVYGILGASLATTISYGIILLGYWIAIRFVYPVPYKYGHFFCILILGTIIYFLSTFVVFNILLSVILKTGLLLLFVVVAILGGYLTKEEVDQARKLVSATGQVFYQWLTSGGYSTFTLKSSGDE